MLLRAGYRGLAETGDLGADRRAVGWGRGAAIVGAYLEAVVAPLAERAVSPPDRAAISAEIARFCQAAVARTKEHA